MQEIIFAKFYRGTQCNMLLSILLDPYLQKTPRFPLLQKAR